MIKLFTVNEMIALEREANESGLSYDEMMDNAGKSIAEYITSAYSHLPIKKIISLIGSGNNGGDALVALSYLASNNWEISAYIVRSRESTDPLIERLVNNNGKVYKLDRDKKYSKLRELLNSNSILIDGVFGTGIKLPLRGDVADVLAYVKKYQADTGNKLHIVAVDCPSGVDCDTGAVAVETIPADITITMAGMKVGLTRFPAAGLCGKIIFGSIGPIEKLSAYKKVQKFILTDDLIRSTIPKRPIDAHKGTFGTAYIIAGSVNFTGASFLAGMAAYRVGVGLVTMAVPTPLHAALAGQFPESTWVLLPDEMGVISSDATKVARQNSDRATAILIGPGFGLEDTSKEFLLQFFTTDKDIQVPVVVDADGLKLISEINDWSRMIPSPAILTPHPGEMSILTGLSVKEILENRIEIAKRYSSKWGHVVVLKGAYTVIANPDGQLAVVPVATSALAKAGTGDVLAGIITGLLSQGLNAFQAAYAGAWIHAQAGLLAERKIGNSASVIASDVLYAIPQVLTDLM